MFVNDKTPIPCITYLETNNFTDVSGDTMEYSSIRYNVKIWAETASSIEDYSQQVDSIMRGLGFRRIALNELSANGVICRVMTYQARYKEIIL